MADQTRFASPCSVFPKASHEHVNQSLTCSWDAERRKYIPVFGFGPQTPTSKLAWSNLYPAVQSNRGLHRQYGSRAMKNDSATSA